MKQIEVAVAVILDAEGHILLTRRANKTYQGGKWEFPGGKRENGEPIMQTLARELEEELGISPLTAEPLIEVPWSYPELQVRLHVYIVRHFLGQPIPRENQPMQWVSPEQLIQLEFPEANQAIVNAIRLPDSYLITPDISCSETLFNGVLEASNQGMQLIQLRAPQLSEDDYFALAERLLQQLPEHCTLLLKGTHEQIMQHPKAGWHLTSVQLNELSQRSSDQHRCIAASCHNAVQLQQAMHLGLNFACLSPIQPTRTHPDAEPLGWQQAQALIKEAQLPVYLLGGLTQSDLAQAKQIGAQGIAAIRGLWPFRSDIPH